MDTDELDNEDDSYCCLLFGHADYQYDPSESDRNYSRMKVCLNHNWNKTDYMITPKSFYDLNAQSGGPMQDNLESYKCGENVAMEVCAE